MNNPNILLITADQLRHDALGCNGNPFIETPHLDKLAAQGTNFKNSFSVNPVCVPARASITTGNYPHKCTGRKENGGNIFDDQPKLAKHFAKQGYATYALGKLHYIPYAAPGKPRLLHGFEHAELCEEGRLMKAFDPEGKQRGVEDYHDYLVDAGWGGYERGHGVGNNDIKPAPSPVPAEHHEETWVADRSIHYLQKHLKENKDKPFLMWASFIKPHAPYDPPEPYHKKYDPRKIPKPMGDHTLLSDRDPALARRRIEFGWDKLSPECIQTARSHYYGMVSYQDAMVGRLLDFLDQNNLSDNTIVVFTADHGDLLGDFGVFFKESFFDGSVRVPLIIRAPGISEKGSIRDHLVGSQDILPTISQLAGCPLPVNVDGMDLSQALLDGNAPDRDYYVAQTGDAPNQKYMVINHQWKYIYCELGGTEELYDVTSPQSDLRNLASDSEKSSILTGMRESLIAWCKENGDETMLESGKLKSSPVDSLPKPEFDANEMGWRYY